MCPRLEAAPDLPVGIAIIISWGCLPADVSPSRELGRSKTVGLSSLLLGGDCWHLTKSLWLLAVCCGRAAAVGGGAMGVDGRALLLLLVMAHGGAKILVPVTEVIVLVGLLIKRQRHHVPLRGGGNLQENSSWLNNPQEQFISANVEKCRLQWFWEVNRKDCKFSLTGYSQTPSLPLCILFLLA